MKTNIEQLIEINEDIITNDHPIGKAIKDNPKKAFETLFTPKQDFHNWIELKEGERCCPGRWIETVFPVMKDRGRGEASHHITETIINKDGKVSWAFSNSCGGITFAPGVTRSTGGDSWGFGSYRYCPWDDVSHFEDHHGNRYEKAEPTRD